MSVAGASRPATIVFATDPAYCQHLAVALLSLLETNAQRAMDLRIICVRVGDEDKARLSAVAAGAGGAVSFIDFDPTPYVGFRVDGHISWASYARIFIPKLMGPEVGRVLYLDSDIVVVGPIAPLLDMDIEGRPMAGVRDPQSDRHGELGLPAGSPYVNGGVLILDLDAWRREELCEHLVHYIAANAERLKFHDQDAVNACLNGRIFPLDPRWNVHHKVLSASPAQLGCSAAERRSMLRDARIVHFTGSSKPWHFMNEHPFKDAYWRALRRTPYRAYRYSDMTAANLAWKAARRSKWIIMSLLGRPPIRWSLR